MRAFLIKVFVITVLFSSCSTSFRSKSSDYQNITKTNVVQMPKYAEYTVGNKVVGSYKTEFAKKERLSIVKTAKDFALANAIESAGCDFLVHPLYDVTIIGRFIEVQVEGYSANYVEFRDVELKDTIFSEVNNVVLQSDQGTVTGKRDKLTPKQMKRRKVLKILGITYLTGAVVAGVIRLTASP